MPSTGRLWWEGIAGAEGPDPRVPAGAVVPSATKVTVLCYREHLLDLAMLP